MRNYLHNEKRFNAILPQAVTVGQLFMYGDIPVYATNTAAAGELTTLLVEGVFTQKVTGQVGQGKSLYFHADTGQVNAIAASGVLIGYALDAVTDAETRLLFVPLAQAATK